MLQIEHTWRRLPLFDERYLYNVDEWSEKMPAPTKNVTIDFFNIVNVSVGQLQSLLEFSIGNRPPINYRNSLYRFHSYNIVRLAGNQCIVGSAIKIITQGIPQKAKLSEPVISDFELEVDEGVGIVTSFLIDPSSNRLLLQRSGMGVRSGAFLNLLDHVCKLPNLELEALLDVDANSRFRRMQTINSYTVRFATPTNPELYEGLSAEYIAKNSTKFGSSKCEIKYTIQTEKRILRDIIQSLKEDALGMVEIGAEKAKVTGKENIDDERSIVLDLISERLKSIVPVHFRGRSLHFEDLEAALTNVYMEKHKYLQENFPVTG